MFLAVILLSQTAHAHHKIGHQNTEPWPEFRRVDCGKLYDTIVLQKKKLQALISAARKDPGQAKAIRLLLPNEIDILNEERYIYKSVCLEI